jgi:hypothetical protein
MVVQEEILFAYVDGELSASKRVAVAKALADNAVLATLHASQERLRATLAAHYDPVLQEDLPERLLIALSPNVVELPTRRPVFTWQNLTAVAATLVAGFFAFHLVPQGDRSSNAEPTFAEAPLSHALTFQLASTQSPDEAIRIGVSFPAYDGRLCRTFEAADVAGLACRAEAGWELVTTGARPAEASPTDYRQVGSASASVLEMAQEMMAGEPFDAQAELIAQSKGWRQEQVSVQAERGRAR